MKHFNTDKRLLYFWYGFQNSKNKTKSNIKNAFIILAYSNFMHIKQHMQNQCKMLFIHLRIEVLKCPLNTWNADYMTNNRTVFSCGGSNETDARPSISVNLWYSMVSNTIRIWRKTTDFGLSLSWLCAKILFAKIIKQRQGHKIMMKQS